MKSRILIIDDENAIISILKIMLEKENYEVLTASDGLEGLEIIDNFKTFENEANSVFELIITDIIMPKLNGFELAKVINNKLPNQKILLISAFSNSKKLFDFVENTPSINFLSKPFGFDDLIEKIDTIVSIPEIEVERRNQDRKKEM